MGARGYKANHEQGVKVIGTGGHKGLSPCQTMAVLSRFITCQKVMLHLNKRNTASVSPLGVDMFTVIF